MTGPRDPFGELLRRLGEISDLEHALALLAWDQETKMPPLGAAARAEHLATVAQLGHERATAPELGELLGELRELEEQSEPESFEASILRVARRDYEKAQRVPSGLRAELTRAGSLGYRAWLQARAERDYTVFQPHLERRLVLMHEYVACHEPYDDPYDVLLDDHEPGLRTAELAAVLVRLEEELVPLVASLGEPADDSCLQGRFAPERQREFALEVLARWGTDESAWRLDDTEHPFAMALAGGDIRLTTHFDGGNLEGVLATMHEFGHGLYERQVDERLARTPLAAGASSGFHESQSRLWENLVGRRASTWRYFYPRLQEVFPAQFARVGLDEFLGALNRIAPGPRRWGADELTYSLHVTLRIELERELLAGRLAAADLPEAFDAGLRARLGVEPHDVVEGVLQDAHWSDSNFGSFPSYVLGNVISVQLWERATAEIGDLDAQFEQGAFGALREWLRERLHRWGRAFEPSELIVRAVGGPLDPEPYLAHLRRKVDELPAQDFVRR